MRLKISVELVALLDPFSDTGPNTSSKFTTLETDQKTCIEKNIVDYTCAFNAYA